MTGFFLLSTTCDFIYPCNELTERQVLMLDFSRVRSKEVTMDELLTGFTRSDLRALTDEMIDAQMKLIEDCTDADVVFQPLDPIANDTFATDNTAVHIAWTLGHVAVHITASAEESAAIAAELACGVEYHGRSRSEIDLGNGDDHRSMSPTVGRKPPAAPCQPGNVAGCALSGQQLRTVAERWPFQRRQPLRPRAAPR